MADVTTKVRVTGGEAAKGILDKVRQGLDNLQDAAKGVAGGTRESTAALNGVQAAAAKAAQGYRTVAEAAQASSAQAAQAFEAALDPALREAALKGTAVAQEISRGLREEFERTQAETKEAQARGLITPAEASERGRAAGKAFNDGVLQLVDGARTTTRLTDESRGPIVAGLVAQLKDLDVAAKRASSGGLRTLARGFAGIATQQLAFRSGLGSILATLGLLTLGTGITLGVTAGLAAIAFGIRKVKQAAEEAREPVKRLADEAERLRNIRLAPFETLGNIVEATAQVANQRDEVNRLEQALAAANRRLNEAPDLIAEQVSAQAAVTRLTNQHAEAVRELSTREATLNGIVAQGRTEATDRRGEEISALARLIDAGAATNAQLERRQVLLRELQGELQQLQAEEARIQAGEIGVDAERQTRVTRIADLMDQINTLRGEAVTKEKEVTRLNREQLDIELARLQLRSIALQTRVASREISAPDALQEEIDLLEERRGLIARTIPDLERQAELLKTPEARAGVAQVNQELAQTGLQIAQLRAQTLDWRDSLEELEFQERVARADPSEAFRLIFERSHGAIREAAEKAGDVAVIAFLDRLVDEGSTRGAADKLLDNLQRDLAGVGRQQQQIEIQLNTGEIDQETFFARRLALLEKERAVIQAALPDLRKYAESLDDPALREALEEMGLQFEQIGLRIHEVRLAMEAWKLEVIDIGEDALAGLFVDLMSATKSYKDAFLDMARAVVQALTRMIAQMIAAKIAQEALGSLFGGGNRAAAAKTAGAVLGGFARGGLVRGPGTGTSDSIYAPWLSDGEYVLRAAVVRRPGMKALLDAWNYGGELPPLRARTTGGYAAGGFVERPRGGGELSGRLDIGLDEGLVVRGLETNAAARALLRVVARDRRAFQRALA